jgi:hypothetical protein
MDPEAGGYRASLISAGKEIITTDKIIVHKNEYKISSAA